MYLFDEIHDIFTICQIFTSHRLAKDVLSYFNGMLYVECCGKTAKVYSMFIKSKRVVPVLHMQPRLE